MPEQEQTQFGALCYRRHGPTTKILLVTSRGTGRWIIPKGWPMDGLAPAQVARQEAWEEAGARGVVHEESLGSYRYCKWLSQARETPCRVSVYALRVRELSVHYPEFRERRRRWFTPEAAARRVAEPELAEMLQQFDPSALFGGGKGA